MTLISDPATNPQPLASIKGVIQSVIERRVLMASLPIRVKKGVASSGDPSSLGGAFAEGVEKQLTRFPEEPPVAEALKSKRRTREVERNAPTR